jgi:hypothetical protein
MDMARRIHRSALAVALLTSLVALPARAASTKTFIALLNGAQETPPTTSTALELALLTFDESTKMLCFSLSFTPLDTGEVAAHVHGPAVPGQSADILFALPPGNPKTSCAQIKSRTQKKDLKKGLLYMNIHSAQHPGGEIRGQIVPTGK